MSLSPFYSFQSRFVTYLLNRPRRTQGNGEQDSPCMCSVMLRHIHVAVVTQLLKRTGHVILTSVAFPGVQHFATFIL